MNAAPQDLLTLYKTEIYIGVKDVIKYFKKPDGNPPARSTAQAFLTRVREYADSVEKDVSKRFPYALVPISWVLKYMNLTVVQLQKQANIKNATTGGNQ